MTTTSAASSLSIPARPVACAPRLTTLLTCAGALLVACGGGGGGGGGDAGAAERNAYFASLEGTWAVSGSDLVVNGGGIPTSIGLEGGTITLDAFLVDRREDGQDGYIGIYKLTLPGADLTSPSFGPQLSAIGVAWYPEATSETFLLAGNQYRPGDDVTVTFGVLPQVPSVDAAVDSFSATYAFSIYDGYQIVSVAVDEPGFDDDGDGEIDEPGEYALEDDIAPDAVLLSEGRMTVQFTRLGGL